MTTRAVSPVYLPPPYQDSAEYGRLILRDGSTATIRVAAPGDRAALREFFAGLSAQSRARRFFSLSVPDQKLIDSFCDNSNPRSQLTLVVTRSRGGSPRIIAAGSYVARDERTAEVAMAVDDAFQGKGLGTLLLERLSILAAQNGIERFWAVTNTDNRQMIDIFRHSGFRVREKVERGTVEVDFAVAPTEASVSGTEIRDRVFTAASLRPFFKPRSVCVVGVSRNASGIGHRIFKALAGRFRGAVYAVNPNARTIDSTQAYASVRELPEPVDLAVLAVPRDEVLQIVDDCAERGVRALVVITAGFAEINEEGRRLQRELVEKVRGYGMRMVGPNCLGLINADPRVQLNASFSPVFPLPGRIAMSSQSGALGLAILSLARKRQLGLSTFVSVGNKADVSGNDLLQYWEEDESTGVILLYLESFGNPRRFARIARRVSRSKPVVCVKAGRTLSGKRAAGSHTAALAGNDIAVEALFRQTGVIRAETLDEMFDLSAFLANQPLPSGPRVAIVTNAGGPGILCADACEAGGLVIPELSEATRGRLRDFLPLTASVSNPVDMIASAGPEHYRQAVATLLASAEVDALVAMYVDVGMADSALVAQAIAEGVKAGRATSRALKPVAVCWMAEPLPEPLVGGQETIPTYAFPESAGRVLAKAAAYREWRAKPLGVVPDFADIQLDAAREICRGALNRRGPGWLATEETRKLLAAGGLPITAGGVATTAEQACELARAVGFPVAVKLASHQVVHKTEFGGVRLNLRNAAAVSRAFAEIRRRVAEQASLDAMEGVLVQPMVSGGVEVMVGVTQDPLFGPLVGFGLGGIHVEILADICFRVTPLTDRDAREMIEGIRGYRLLQGYRGHPPADLSAIEEVLLRISRMVEEIPAITELDLNPIFALAPGKGCRIVDARVRVGTPST
ncbi:MAG TPA: GNAT family N-acetyltransferase [Candidatus Acidoferrales bacterium]|nr:GNAT family N-acetyltransferase [Candidatus Acidoferrales bacterium]